MAEAMVLVCDVDGRPAVETVKILIGGRTLSKDLCATHLAELLAGAHAPRRGRPRKAAEPVAATTAAAPRRRGRPPKAAQAAPLAAARAGRKRRPITDPVVLQKRRDALAKARAARAAKRAAAT